MNRHGGSKIMKFSNYFTRGAGRFATTVLLGGTLVAAAGVAPAGAQERRFDDSQQSRQWRVSRADVVRIAQANGYSEGFESGLQDKARSGRMSYRSQAE